MSTKRRDPPTESSQPDTKRARAETVQDFPRGGANVLTPLEMRTARLQAKEDFLFESAAKEAGGAVATSSRKAARSASKAKKQARNAKGPKGKRTTTVAAATANSVPLLTFNRLKEGMRLLACVRVINDFDVELSLPSNLVAYLPVTNVSTPLSALLEKEIASDNESDNGDEDEDEDDALPSLDDLFAINQYVVVSITMLERTDKGTRIEVSTNPEAINADVTQLAPGISAWACVKSVEDHGYVVDFGNAALPTGFLSDKAAGDNELHVGQPLLVRVGGDEDTGNAKGKKKQKGKKAAKAKTSANTRVLPVTLLSNGTNDVGADEQEETPLHDDLAAVLALESLQPGMLVKGKVTKVRNNGLELSFLVHFTGTVDWFHIPMEAQDAQATLEEMKGTTVTARIVYVDMRHKSVGLSLQPFLLDMNETPSIAERVQLGQIFRKAVVRRIDEGVGILLQAQLDDDDDEDDNDVTLYAHISRASDERVSSLRKEFQLGQELDARALSLNTFENVVNVTLEQSLLDEPYLRVEDVNVGDDVQATVLSVESWGLVLSLGHKLRAVCPSIHLGDVPVKTPAKKFKKGKTLAFRVWDVDVDKKRITLTRKRTLLNTENGIITSYEGLQHNQLAHGVVTNIRDRSVAVTFYNNVYGTVSLRHMARTADDDTDPHDLYSFAQPVLVRVLSCDPSRERLRLSMLTSEQDMMDTDSRAPSSSKGPVVKVTNTSETFALVSPGDVVSAHVLSSSSKGLLVRLGTSADSGAVALLPWGHLSDHASLAELWHTHSTRAQAGSTLDEVLVLRANKERLQLTVTMKPSLLAAARSGDLPSSVRKAKKKMVLRGYVSSTTAYGCFVGFMDDLSGLAHKANLADRFVSNPQSLFGADQSVAAVVQAVDKTNAQLELSLRPSDVGLHERVELLEGFIEEREVLASHAAEEPVAWLQSVRLGQVVALRVTAVSDEQVELSADDADGVVCVAAKHNAGSMHTYKKGKRVQGCVLDVDVLRARVDVALDTELVGQAEEAKGLSQKATGKLLTKSASKRSGEARVLLLKKDYAVVAGTVAGKFAVMYAALQELNSKGYLPDNVRVGEEYPVCLEQSVSVQGGHVVIVSLEGSGSASGSAGSSTASSSVEQGSVLKARISLIKDDYVMVKRKGFVGRVHITELHDEAQDDAMAGLSTGEEMEVVAMAKNKEGRWECSARASALGEGRMLPRLNELQTGDDVHGYVQRVTKDAVWVHVSSSLRGRVRLLDVSTKLKQLRNLQEHFVAGDPVRAVVLSADSAEGTLDLAMDGQELDCVVTDALLPGRVLGPAKRGDVLRVQLPRGHVGRVHVTHVSDHYQTTSAKTLAMYSKGDLVRVYVLDADEEHRAIDLSLRPSRTGVAPKGAAKPTSACVAQEEIADATDVQAGDLVHGFVRSVTKKGCFITLGPGLAARALISELSDKFVRDPTKQFPVGLRVTARVVSVDEADEGKIDLSLRRSKVAPSKASAKRIGWDELKEMEGTVVKGHIKSLADYGVFVRIKNSDISGLCHVRELADEYVEKPSDLFKPGDLVKAKIVDVDVDNKRVAFSLKPSEVQNDTDNDNSDSDDENDDDEYEHISASAIAKSRKQDEDEESESESEDDDEEDDEEDDDVDVDALMAKWQAEDDDDDDDDDVIAVDSDDDDSENDNDGSDDSDVEDEDDSSDDDDDALVAKAKKRAGFQWDNFHLGGAGSSASARRSVDSDEGETDDEDSDEEGDPIDEEDIDDEEDMDADKRKSKKKRQAERREREMAIQEREEAMADDRLLPETADDYDKLVMGNPDSSYVWMKYMSYYITLAEIDKAREIGKRALQTISIRQPGEKFNVWVALLNLENAYGSDDSLMQTFQEALLYNDKREMYFQLVDILQRSGKQDMVKETFATMCKKFRESSRVWLALGKYQLEQDDVQGARDTLARSLKSLPRRKHLQTILKFAKLEFTLGEPERGRTLFEEMVSNYPRRNDFWLVYIDAELNLLRKKHPQGDVAAVRRLYDRAIHLKLSSKKMRTFFKRFAKFEQRYGDAERVQYVVEKAEEYLNE